MLSSEYYTQIFHEIKNSVTLINSYLQLIEKKHSEIAGFDYWRISKNEAARLCAITTELSQVKLGTQLILESVDLRKFLAVCCAGFQCSAGKENISCSLSMPTQPLLVRADTKQLRLAFVNLLKNSCEAMEHNGIILLNAFPKSGQAVIRITDFGCGIAPDMLTHIFDPFVTSKEDGSGLGLNITKEIILAHNGSICVNSQPGNGCTFTVTLPAVPADSSDTEALPV